MSGAAASGNEAARATSAGARPSGHRARMTRWLIVFGLLAPALLLYATVYLGGMAIIGLASFGLGPDAESGATLANYREVFASAHIQTVVLRTLRVSAITVIACLVLGFPVARYITSPDARWRSFVVMAVLSPLMVSAIGRVFGWIALFGPGSWVAAQTMHFFGTRATGLLYTEAGVVIGLTNILLPFMVLSIAASRANLDESLLKAAASLGATPSAVFWQVELPLNLPGILGGVLIVFSLSITNFATAALLGGSGRDVVAYEIYSNILTYHQPGTGTALAILLLVCSVAIMMLAIWVGRRADAMQAARVET